MAEDVVTVGKSKKDLGKHGVIWLILGIELLPLYMMLQISVKDNQTFMLNPWFPSLPDTWQLENLSFGFRLVFPYIANTVFVAVSATVLALVFAICAAYFFARYQMPFSKVLWAIFLVLMLMPGVTNIVPLFTLLKDLSLLNTLWALIMISAAGGQVFNIFILRNFIEDLPKDLFEAAEIDGATHLQQIINVVIPLCAPIIGTLGILAFIVNWNDFLMPLLILRDQNLFTLGVGLIYLDGEYVKQWGKVMASFLVASIPLIVLFLFTMKLFVRGLTSGAVKG